MFSFLVKCSLWDGHNNHPDTVEISASSADTAIEKAKQHFSFAGLLVRRAEVYEKALIRDFPFLPEPYAVDDYCFRKQLPEPEKKDDPKKDNPHYPYTGYCRNCYKDLCYGHLDCDCQSAEHHVYF